MITQLSSHRYSNHGGGRNHNNQSENLSRMLDSDRQEQSEDEKSEESELSLVDPKFDFNNVRNRRNHRCIAGGEQGLPKDS